MVKTTEVKVESNKIPIFVVERGSEDDSMGLSDRERGSDIGPGLGSASGMESE